MSKTAVEKTSLDRTLIRLEEDNGDLRQQLHCLQTQLSHIEQEHAQRLVLRTQLGYNEQEHVQRLVLKIQLGHNEQEHEQRLVLKHNLVTLNRNMHSG